MPRIMNLSVSYASDLEQSFPLGPVGVVAYWAAVRLAPDKIVVFPGRPNGHPLFELRGPMCPQRRHQWRRNRDRAPALVRLQVSEPFPSWLCFAELQCVDGLGGLTGAPGGEGPGPPEARPRRRWRELSVPEGRWARSVPAVAEPPSATGRWLAAGSLDSHLGGARTLILPGRIGPATRESA
jgi:hypothetical protein